MKKSKTVMYETLHCDSGIQREPPTLMTAFEGKIGSLGGFFNLFTKDIIGERYSDGSASPQTPAHVQIDSIS